MTFSSVAALRSRPHSRANGLVGIDARDRWLERRVWAAWGALMFNVLTFSQGLSVIPIPKIVGQGLQQGSLVVALLLALTCNKNLAIRPSFFMILLSLLALECVITALNAQYPLGTDFRVGRFLLFVTVMWLLTPYWGRQDMLLVRCHLKTLILVAVFQLVGLIIAPGKTLGNRFPGVIWPIPGTQVAHYMAVLCGIVLILWFCGEISAKAALLLAPAALVILILTHTRTALIGCAAGVIVAGLSLISVAPRARKFFTAVIVLGATAWLTASSAIRSWLARGENASALDSLSGRTNFWGPLLAYPRTRFQELFGFGIGNGTFGGLPIDSNWMLSYEQQGLWGIAICASIIIFLYVSVSFAPRGPKRALALFLITYCLIASYTEDGFTTPTTYMLDVFLAASLLVPFGTISDRLNKRARA